MPLFSQNVSIFINELSDKIISTRFLLSKWPLDCSSGQLGPEALTTWEIIARFILPGT